MNDQQHNIFLRYLFFLFMEGCLLLSVGGTSNRIFSRLENSPSTDIIDITKDKYGFIWFASNDGIYRFDGYDVIVYSIRSEKNNRIEHEAVWTTFLDQDEQLWIAGGDAGCSRYDYESDVFLNYDSATVSGRHFMRHIKDLEQDHNGIIWAGGDNGLFYYDPEQDGFRMMDYTTDDGEPIELFNELFIDQDDVFWIGDEFGNLYNLDRTNGYITRYKKGYFKNKGTNRKIVWKILQDSRGEIWVVGEEMALSINPQSGVQKSIADQLINSMEVPSITEAKDGKLWISARGVNIYDPITNSMEHCTGSDDETTISSNVTNSIFYDSNGVFWIGSWYGGVSKFNEYRKPIKHFQHQQALGKGLSNNVVHTIYEDDLGDLWIGCEDGVLNRYRPSTGQYFYYKDSLMSYNEAITGVVPGEGKDELVIGAWGCLKVFDKKTGQFTRYEHDINDSTSLSGTRIPKIISGSDNNVWIGVTFSAFGGLDEFRLKDKSIVHHAFLPENFDCRSRVTSVKSLYEDSYGKIWILGWAALHVYDTKTHCFRLLDTGNDVPLMLDKGQVNCCYQDRKDRLWIGNNKGLNLYNYEGDYFMKFGSSQGMAGVEVHAILEDGDGNLWLATDVGISKFMLPSIVDQIDVDSAYVAHIPDDFSYFYNYNKDDGFQDGKYNSGAYRGRDGTMYFVGTDGISSFKPEELKLDTVQSPIRFTELRLFNKVVGPQDGDDSPIDQAISLADEITLSYQQYIFSLKWASLNYYATAKVQYAYMLEGFDKEWNFVGNVRNASYTGLPTGEYVFRVKATNSDGMWNQKEASIKVRILPPWWESWWFKLLSVVVLLAAIVLIIYARIRVLKKQQDVLQKTVKERTKDLQEANSTKDRFFSIISHDLRNPFQTLLGYSDLLLNYYYEYSDKERIDVLQQINSVSQKTLDLLEDLLTWSIAQSGKIDYRPENIDVHEYVERNVELMKSIAEKKNITLKSTIPDKLSVYGDVNTSDTILRNLLSNALKFTPRFGVVEIEVARVVSYQKHYIQFNIKDTGIGMSKEKINTLFGIDKNKSTQGTEKEKGTGLGLMLCSEFVKSNNGQISVESELGKGSVFAFTLPESKF